MHHFWTNTLRNVNVLKRWHGHRITTQDVSLLKICSKCQRSETLIIQRPPTTLILFPGLSGGPTHRILLDVILFTFLSFFYLIQNFVCSLSLSRFVTFSLDLFIFYPTLIFVSFEYVFIVSLLIRSASSRHLSNQFKLCFNMYCSWFLSLFLHAFR